MVEKHIFDRDRDTLDTVMTKVEDNILLLQDMIYKSSDFMIQASNLDTSGIYTVIKKFRKEDATLFSTSELQLKDLQNKYTKCVITYYDELGTTITETKEYTIKYTSDGYLSPENSSIQEILILHGVLQYYLQNLKKVLMEYTDAQIGSIKETGTSKLVSFNYDILATTDGQTDFEIPTDVFDKYMDTIVVFSNTRLVPASDYIIQQVDATKRGHIVLENGISKDSLISIIIFKNVPIGDGESILNQIQKIVNSKKDTITVYTDLKVSRNTLAVNPLYGLNYTGGNLTQPNEVIKIPIKKGKINSSMSDILITDDVIIEHMPADTIKMKFV